MRDAVGLGVATGEAQATCTVVAQVCIGKVGCDPTTDVCNPCDPAPPRHWC